jgi:hypothetical protein
VNTGGRKPRSPYTPAPPRSEPSAADVLRASLDELERFRTTHPGVQLRRAELSLPVTADGVGGGAGSGSVGLPGSGVVSLGTPEQPLKAPAAAEALSRLTTLHSTKTATRTAAAGRINMHLTWQDRNTNDAK